MKLRVAGVTAVALLASLTLAQDTTPRATGTDPASGKVGDILTVRGDHLGKQSVAGVYLSDADKDYKGTVVEQGDSKIVFTIPEVKSGDYSISIKVGNNIFIQPVRFKVEE